MLAACGGASEVTAPVEAAPGVAPGRDAGDVGLVLQGSVKDGTISVAQVEVNSAAAAACAVFPGISQDGCIRPRCACLPRYLVPGAALCLWSLGMVCARRRDRQHRWRFHQRNDCCPRLIASNGQTR